MPPPSAREKPVSTLNRVGLPAPSGPISPVTAPSGIAKSAPSTARSPPNLLTTASTCRMGSVTAEQHLLALAEEPLRPQRHEHDEDEADDHEPDRRHLVRAHRELDESRPLEDRPEQERPGDDPEVAREAAEDEDCVAEERERRFELVRVDDGHVEREEVAGDRAERGGDHQRLELVDEHVLSQRACGVLVLADRA